MSKYIAKLGLWEHELIGTCAYCKLETDWAWSDEQFDEPVSACSIAHWAAYWDGRVTILSGRRPPRTSVVDMDSWSRFIGYRGRLEGPKGLSHTTGEGYQLIEFRLEDTTLAGILFHTPHSTLDGRPLPGNISVWVYPAFQGQGIGSKLGCAAARRFGINLGAQTFTGKGATMASRAFRGHPLASAYRRK